MKGKRSKRKEKIHLIFPLSTIPFPFPLQANYSRKKPMNILLVDDDYLLAKGTAKLLERLGNHQVLITDSPEEIFQRTQAGEVDLVLMDVNLPEAQWNGEEVSGADISQILKTEPKTAEIPIILVTAYAMQGEQQKLLAISQADGFFAKPITEYDSLLQLMAQLHEARLQNNLCESSSL
jgi:CheY-like chemotaxis protein